MQPSDPITVVLLHSVKYQREMLGAGTVQCLPADIAAQLIRRGSAALPPESLVAPALPVAGKIVHALSPDGARFVRLGEKKAAALVLETRDAAGLAEFQALEYRREDGARAVVLEALAVAFGALQSSEHTDS